MGEMYVHPQILSTYLPTGPAAPAEAITGIQETFQKMSDCAKRAEGFGRLQTFYSDDFFRRNVASFGPNGYDWIWDTPDEEDLAAGFHAFELSDGRIAATTGDNVTGPQELFIFVEQDGHWLIDEYYGVVTEFFYGPMG
jgi:hypothetical protein